jgi:hypothetical protein
VRSSGDLLVVRVHDHGRGPARRFAGLDEFQAFAEAGDQRPVLGFVRAFAGTEERRAGDHRAAIGVPAHPGDPGTHGHPFGFADFPTSGIVSAPEKGVHSTQGRYRLVLELSRRPPVGKDPPPG